MALEITDANFEQEVLQSDKPILLDFWAAWCGPCLAIAPMIEELANDMEGTARVGKVDIDNNPGIAAKYGIRAIPTLMIFDNGEVVEQMVGGNVRKASLAEKLNSIAGPTA
ncbi:MAG: thioredoxin [Ignavibacteriae bacterium]|nr:thioredoxin [Ignavibacteriota bacterium]MCB9217593.1 thioredoxin [Ignavibacteria bacterium]